MQYEFSGSVCDFYPVSVLDLCVFSFEILPYDGLPQSFQTFHDFLLEEHR